MEEKALTIDPSEVLRYMGCGTETNDLPLLAQIRHLSDQLCHAVHPKVLWKVFPYPFSEKALTACLGGEDIIRHLSHCTQVIFLAATLGSEAERMLARAQVQDMTEAMILDSCGSALIEEVCDRWETEMTERFGAEGLYLTDRFSPGYGDYPIAKQRQVCDLLEVRRIGLTLSQSGIMIPRKSVTALVGVSNQPRHHRSRGCEGCAMFERCSIRKGGKRCEG